ncbi:MAG TPA: hypothetical protein VHV55_25435 [Pirellulales bacterium]|jgi:hypothetical protein|nr:hypothetical protein [Pirellulales bacterium]
MRLPLVVAGLIAVATVRVIVGPVVYRDLRDQPDFVVFYLPAIGTFVANWILLWRSGLLSSRAALRALSTVAIAFILTAFSTLCAMTIAFNRYGS